MVDSTHEFSGDDQGNSTERKLPEYKDLFQNMFTQHDAIMLLIEPNSGQIVDANKKALDFYGYTRPELTGMKIQEINSHPDEDVTTKIQQALNENGSAFHCAHKLANGEIRLVEVHSSPISLKGKTYLFSIIHDITERQVTEDTIRSEASFLNTIINNSPIAMWVSDAQGTIIQVNSSLLRILNIPEQAVIGKYNIRKDQNLVKQKVMPKVEMVFESKVPARFVVWWEGEETGLQTFRDANSVWIDVSMVPIVDAEDNLVNVVCQWVNITDMKQATDEIRSLSKFPDENPNPILRFSKEGEILYASKSSALLLKKWGRSIGDYVPQYWEKEIKSAISANTNLEIEIECEGRTLSFILAPITDMGYVNAYGRDITENRKITEKLERYQKRYEKAQEIGHVGNWEYDPVTTEFWGSDEAKRIYGFTSEKSNFTTETVEGCILERERVHQALIDLIEHDKKYDLVFDIITDDEGIRKTIHSIAEVERDPQGNAIKITGVISDITELKKTEKALQDSEIRYRTYIEHAPLGIFVVDSNGEFTDVNPVGSKLLGYSMEELLQLSISDVLVYKEDIQGFNQLKNAGEADADLKLKKKDGSQIEVRVGAVPILKDQFIAFCMDITERNRYLVEIQQERDKAQKYLDVADVVILKLNTEGDITLINQKGKQILGYEDDNLIGRNWFETCIPENRKEEVKQVHKLIVSGQLKGYEYIENVVKTKSGEERIILWHNTILLGEKGKRIETLSSGQDITEQKINEEKLKQSEEQYRSVVEDSPGLICKFLSDGTIIFANEAYCKFLGEGLDRLIGKNVREFIPTATRDFEWSKITSLTKESPIQVSETDNINAEGSIRRLRWTNRALFTEEGVLLNFQSFGEDITELNRSQQFLSALNRASLAMQSATTYEEVLDAIGKELKQLDISCYLMQLDENREKAFIKYLSHDSSIIKTVEKLVNINHEQYLFSFDAIDLYRDVVQKKKTLFTENIEKLVKQMLPANLRSFSTKIVKILNIMKDISVPLIVDEEVVGIFSMESNDLTRDDIPAATAFADRLSATWSRITLLQDLRKIVDGTINIIVATVEVRDPYTAGHQKRVADLAGAIAKEMDLTDDQIEAIKMAGVVHDLGKVNIPAEILSKPGKISELEYELIKTHPQSGYELIKHIDFPWPIGEMILQHHERIDGSGYPSGLKGDEIMLEARILAVADIIEAMASHRPYRPALGIEQALAQIKHDKGKSLDPEVVEACLKVFKKGYKLPKY